MKWINPASFTQEQLNDSYALIRKKKSIRHLLTPFQRGIHDLIFKSNSREGGFYCTRKLGKTYCAFLCAHEYASKFPNKIIRIIFPDRTEGARTIESMYSMHIQRLIPHEMRPIYLRSEPKKQFIYKNGSVIFINGAHPDHVEKGRGPSCDLFLFDEIAAWKGNVNYALKSVFYPQGTLTQAKKIYMTTPPKDIDCHFINEIYPRLKKKNTLYEATIYDNILLSKEEIEVIKEEMGGENSPDFQREYLLKIIPERSRILVPEFLEQEHVWEEHPSMLDVIGAPMRFKTYITIDVGVKDRTFMLTGYYDHFTQKLIIIHEWVYEDWMQKYLNSIIEEHNRICEEILVPNYLLITDQRNYLKHHNTKIDCFEQTKKTLEDDFDFEVDRVKKRRVDDSVGFLRSLFVNNKILINPECKLLIHQLKTCVWKDSIAKNPEIDRDKNSEISHGDGIMALIYMAREIDFHYFHNNRSDPMSQIKFKVEDRNIYEPKKDDIQPKVPNYISHSWTRSVFRNNR